MKNKRGEITLENTLTVILAVFGLFLLFLGALKLYQIVVSQEQENAKNLLNTLEAKINNLNDGETGRFQIRGVENWFLVGWNKDDPNRPIDKIECFLDSCICICKGNKEKVVDACQKDGFCRKVNFNDVAIFEFLKYLDKKTLVNENDVIKDIRNPKYQERKIWEEGGTILRPLLNNACPSFYENNLIEILIYKDKTRLSILNIYEEKVSRFEAACSKIT